MAMRRLQSRNKFVDLGHGIGKAIMAAILVADFREYHGIEILRGGWCRSVLSWRATESQCPGFSMHLLVLCNWCTLYSMGYIMLCHNRHVVSFLRSFVTVLYEWYVDVVYLVLCCIVLWL